MRHDSSAPGDGSIEAGELFERHSERLLSYCLHVLRDRSEAEDAVQTTFLYAHRALQRGVVPDAEYAWLHSIAKNVCRWQLRTTARRRRGLAEADVDAIAAPHGDREGSDEALDLTEALASLPEGQRRALLLREWHGLSSSEVAARLGMSAPATYALLTRARRSLVSAMSKRPALSLNLGPLLVRIKGLFAGGSANVVTTTAVAAGLAVGGITVTGAIHGQRPGSEERAVVTAPRSEAGVSARDRRGQARVPRAAGRSFAPTASSRRGDGLGMSRAARRAGAGSAVEAPTTSEEPAQAGGLPTTPSDPGGTTEPTGDPIAATEGSSKAAAPPDEELPNLPILGELPLLGDLPIVGDIGAAGDDDGAASDPSADPVDQVVDAVPDVPLPDVKLPPLLP